MPDNDKIQKGGLFDGSLGLELGRKLKGLFVPGWGHTMIDKHLLSFIKELRDINHIIDKYRSGWRLKSTKDDPNQTDKSSPGTQIWQS